MVKMLSGSADRDQQCKTFIEGGGFRYELIADFPKYPNSDWQFIDVSSGFCDKDDVVYVLMRGLGNDIVKLDSEGNYLGAIHQKYIHTPHFGCMTPDDHLLIMNLFAHQGVEITKEGELVRMFGSGKPSDTGCDNLRWRRNRRYGTLVPTEVEEAYSNNKWEFYTTLSTITRTGGPFNSPTSCAVNPRTGEYVFGDGYGNCAVHRFDRDGNYLSTWGEPAFHEDGTCQLGPGKFSVVHGVAIDSKDRIWANDRDGDAVNVYAPDGTVAAYIQGNLGQPSDLWYDGTYMYCVGRGGYLTIFNDDIEIVAQLGYYNSDLKAHGMCGNSKGDLFLFPTHANPDHQVIKLKRLH